MSESVGLRAVGYADCAGGGQVVACGDHAYVGLMGDGEGTLVIDVSDPSAPRTVANIPTPALTHSHKVRVANDLMVVNREILDPDTAPDDVHGGIGIFDVADPANPRPILEWTTPGKGVHRFDFDGRYAYLSATRAGFVGHIVYVLDLADPARPVEVCQWWMPGQNVAAGEVPTWEGVLHRCHHPLRLGDRLYVSYWHGGFVILDIADLSRPKFVSGLDWSPPFPWPTHTALPVPFPVRGRSLLVVADEDVARIGGETPSFLWMVDITDERHPMPFGSFQVADVDGSDQPRFTGCHQPCEIVQDTILPVAWFAHGVRLVDISNPHAPREAGRFLPDPPPGEKRVQSNDVTVDANGLVYVTDRKRGLHILERT